MEEVLSSVADGFLFVDSSTNLASARLSLEISAQYPCVYTTLGFHPFWGKEFVPEVIGEYETFIKENPKVIGVGEVGLDYKAEVSPREQEAMLLELARLAQRNAITLLIHNRFDSWRILEVLDSVYENYSSVIFHCFSYGVDFLDEIIKRGGYASFSLNVLRKKTALHEALKRCPTPQLLLETDSPYMKIKDRASTPLDVRLVYECAATVRETSVSDLEAVVRNNAQRVFTRI